MESKADELLEVGGVVNIRELLTNEQNLSIEVVGANRGRIKDILYELNAIGIHVERTQMMNRERDRPFDEFGKQYTSEASE